MTLKILIADDEPGVLFTLEEIISGIQNVSVVGKASTVQDAYYQILQTEPDVVILDIHFPDGSGIKLAERLFSADIDFNVVFLTVDPNFTLDAYKMYSYDYILKPFDENRVIRTIMRLKKQKEKGYPTQISEKTEAPYRIAVKKGQEIVLINPETIIFLEKAAKKVTIHHCSDIKYELTDTLERLEKELNRNFFRSHKSYLINVDYIQKIVPWNENTYQIHFKNTNKQAALSRRKFNELLERIARLKLKT